MKRFAGFPAGKVRFTSIPDVFFSHVLPSIDDLGELKVTLHVFWKWSLKKGSLRAVSRSELHADPTLLGGLQRESGERDPVEHLDEALNRAVERGTLLRLARRLDGREETWFFVNSPLGRRMVEGVERGDLALPGERVPQAAVPAERPNIFTLYEQNIGLLTPLIAEELQEAERDYPAEWIEDAFREAIRNNARKWSYIRAILRSWESEGRDETHGRDPKEDGRRYIEGKYADYIQH